MRKLWDYFSGRKTVIGTCLLCTQAVIDQVVMGIWEIGAESWAMINTSDTLAWVGMAFGGVGLSHKWVKNRRSDDA